MNIESVPSEAGPDLYGIEQGIANDKVEKQRTGDGKRTAGAKR